MKVASHVRFGIYDFDLSNHELRREGVQVRLQAQPGLVLAVLVEHAGKVVTRDRLRDTVWGTETFVDFDRGLNFCIAQIRAALGDSADSPRFVRTIPKQGYQFIAPVGPAVPLEQAVPVSVSPKPFQGRYALLAGVGTVVCALLIVIILLRHSPTINIAITRFDNETGSADMDRFADGLTDAVVAEMTAAGGAHYGIIGNAGILRKPRNQRDLMAIGSSLKVGYVVLGQVQRNSSQIRVLAHLIRLPEQTHLWVARFDRKVADPLQTENELARLIAQDFARRLAASPVPALH